MSESKLRLLSPWPARTAAIIDPIIDPSVERFGLTAARLVAEPDLPRKRRSAVDRTRRTSGPVVEILAAP